MAGLEPPMQYITMQRASEISGVSAATLGNRARAGRLHAVKLGHTLVTTRVWLHEYLMSRGTRGHTKTLPESYVAPEGQA